MSDSPKTPADFTDTGIPITAWSFYEVFERKHCGTGWLRSQMSDIEIKLTAAKQRLDEVTKQRDGLVTAGENLMMATEKIGAPVSSAEWIGYTIVSVAMHSAIKAAKGGES